MADTPKSEPSKFRVFAKHDGAVAFVNVFYRTDDAKRLVSQLQSKYSGPYGAVFWWTAIDRHDCACSWPELKTHILTRGKKRNRRGGYQRIQPVRRISVAEYLATGGLASSKP